jgi:hypothetical protein
MKNQIPIYHLNPLCSALLAVYIPGYKLTVLLHENHATMVLILASIFCAAEYSPKITAFQILNSIDYALMTTDNELQVVTIHE